MTAGHLWKRQAGEATSNAFNGWAAGAYDAGVMAEETYEAMEYYQYAWSHQPMLLYYIYIIP